MVKSRTVLIALGGATFAVWLTLCWLAVRLLAPQAPTARPMEPSATVEAVHTAVAEPTSTLSGIQFNPDVSEDTPGPSRTTRPAGSDTGYMVCAQAVLGEALDVMDSIAIVASSEDPSFLCEFVHSWQISVAPLVARHAVCPQPSSQLLTGARRDVGSALESLETEVEYLDDFCNGGFDANSLNRAQRSADEVTRFLGAAWAKMESYAP